MLRIGDIETKLYRTFNYLGNENGRRIEIEKVLTRNGEKKLLKGRRINLETMKTGLEIYIRSAVLYGVEHWTVSSRIKQRIEEL